MSAQSEESVAQFIDNLITQRDQARSIAARLEEENFYQLSRVRDLERLTADLLEAVQIRELAK
jgi:hypothetical protein